MNKNHRWNTDEYEKRAKQLYRTEFHKLYPSEAWALYPTLIKCKDVLDSRLWEWCDVVHIKKNFP